MKVSREEESKCCTWTLQATPPMLVTANNSEDKSFFPIFVLCFVFFFNFVCIFLFFIVCYIFVICLVVKVCFLKHCVST